MVVILCSSALLAQGVQKVRDAAASIQSSNNLHLIAIATLDCESSFGKFPSAVGNFFPGNGPQVPNNGYGPILFHILPYIEQDPLYKSTLAPVGTVPLFGSWNVAGMAVKEYLAPADPTLSTDMKDHTSYLANSLALPYGGSRIASFIDGTSQTLLYAEAYARAVDTFAHAGLTVTTNVERRWWDDPTWDPALSGVTFQVAPEPKAASARLPQGFFAAGIQVAMADASVHPVAPTCSAKTFFDACTPNGNVPLGDDW
jgi:hypothetical protein